MANWMDNPAAVMNIGVAGWFGEKSQPALDSARALFNFVIEEGSSYCSEKYGFSGEPFRVNLFTSPEIGGREWLEPADNKILFANAIASSKENTDLPSDYKDKLYSLVNLEDKDTVFSGNKTFIAEWIASRVDLAIVLWDGGEDGPGAAGWLLLQACRRLKVPVVWMDMEDPSKIYWAGDSYYDSFNKEGLKEYMATLFNPGDAGVWKQSGVSVPFYGLWMKLYTRFMKKYKAQAEAVPYVKDILLDPAVPFEASESASTNHQRLAGAFQQLDMEAGRLSRLYNSSLYFRAVVPLIITVFITIGFYIENVVGFIYQPQVGGKLLNLWAYTAGIGFFIHAFLNYHVFALSKNNSIHTVKRRFLYHRFAAEYLRVSLHFIPLGIPVYFKADRFGDKLLAEKPLVHKLRALTRDMEPMNVDYDRVLFDKLLDHLEKMVEDQSAYHITIQRRYALIVKRLKALSGIFFFVGFFFVLARGVLQLALVPLDLNGIVHNGINLKTFIKSSANMLALFLPAVASYFSAKLSLCNFEGLFENSCLMEKELAALKKNIAHLRLRNHPTYESLFILSREVLALMTGEVKNWYYRMQSQNFTRL